MDSRSSTEGGGAASNVKDSLSDKEIVGLCIDFMLAGYETTKNSMSYISYLLATNSDKQDVLCTAIDEYYQENEVSGNKSNELHNDFDPILEQLKKFVKNPILIGISSNFLHNISTCICIRKCNKNGEFSPFHF